MSISQKEYGFPVATVIVNVDWLLIVGMFLFLLISLWGRCYYFPRGSYENIEAQRGYLSFETKLKEMKLGFRSRQSKSRSHAVQCYPLCSNQGWLIGLMFFSGLFIFCYSLRGIQASILYLHLLAPFWFVCLLLFVKHSFSNYNM